MMRLCRSRIGHRLLAMVIALGGAICVVAPVDAAGHRADAAIQLAPAIVAAPRSAQARGVFYTRMIQASLPGAPIRLASSPDGTGELCSDDQATITFARTGQREQPWMHRFTADDQSGIVCIQPQQIMVPAGNYEITIVLEDLYPDTFGSRPYYLVVPPANHDATARAALDGPGQPSLPAATLPTPPPTRLAQSAVGPAAASHQPGLATQIVPTPAAPSPTHAASPPSVVSASPIDPRVFALVIAMLLVVALAMMIGRRRPRGRERAPAQLTGIVDLFDRETREARTVILQAGGPVEVRRRPLAVVALPVQEQSGSAIVRILPTPEGPALQELGAAESALLPLRHDLTCVIAGTVELRYRAQNALRTSQDGARAGIERPR